MYRPRAKFNANKRQIDRERAALAAFDPPIEIIGVPPHGRAQTPLIFASPHSGSLYPQAWLAQCRLSLSQLRKAEDIFIDDLFAAAAAIGAPLLKANFPRSFVDVNRCASEIPPDWSDHPQASTLRAKGGLGVIPMVISHGEGIYHAPPGPAAGAQRLAQLHRPYHAALERLILSAKAAFGFAVLIDCHSMPGFGPLHVRRSDIILGDRYGKSCSAPISDLTAQLFARAGYGVSKNHPYAGGYTTVRYGDPKRDVHAIQIEVNRDLYVNPVTLRPKPRYEWLKADIAQIIIQMDQAFSEDNLAQAAE